MKTSETYNKAFDKYLYDELRGTYDTALSEGKTDNGYLIPRGCADGYETKLADENLFRRYGTVKKIGGTSRIYTVKDEAEAGIVDENNDYPTDSKAVNIIPVNLQKLGVITKINTHLMADTSFDLRGHLNSELARRFGRTEERLFINSSGESEPEGILNAAETGCATTNISYDDIIRLYFSLESGYRRNAVWIMNDETAFTIKTLKSDAGDYLWNSNNGTLLGKPVAVSKYMPSAESGQLPVIFGDLSYYWILENQPLTVQRISELYALEYMIGFKVREYLDGKLIRHEAVKALKIE